jgi:hypothetical protein
MCIEPYIVKRDTNWRLAVPSRTRVIAYLLYTAQGLTYTNISILLGIGKMTACECVRECTYAICRHMFSTYIRLPSPQEARANMEKWKQKTNIPGIFGAIDGTHIGIKKPGEYGQDYLNRKGSYSTNVQGSYPYPSHMPKNLIQSSFGGLRQTIFGCRNWMAWIRRGLLHIHELLLR